MGDIENWGVEVMKMVYCRGVVGGDEDWCGGGEEVQVGWCGVVKEVMCGGLGLGQYGC